MTRLKLTALLITCALAAAGVGIVLLKRNETPAPVTPAAAAEVDAERPGDNSPAQIEHIPQQSQDVFTPPPTHAVGMSPRPAKQE